MSHVEAIWKYSEKTALSIMPNFLLQTLNQVGSKVVQVKGVMLLSQPNSEKTPPSKAVRQIDFEYCFG